MFDGLVLLCLGASGNPNRPFEMQERHVYTVEVHTIGFVLMNCM